MRPCQGRDRGFESRRDRQNKKTNRPDGDLFFIDKLKSYSKISLAGAMAESADATDLKSVVGNNVRVRPPLAPQMSLRLLTQDVAMTFSSKSKYVYSSAP
jgi:hypothetical protein